MKKRIYLHIGLHKTGTTSIQWALTFSRGQISRHGFLYPAAGTPEWARFGHHLVAWSAVQREYYLPTFNGNRASFSEESRAETWRLLHEEIAASTTSTVVLSSEEFDILTPAEIHALASELARYDVTPVLFLRNYADWLESSYRTTIVHSNYVRPIEEFVDDQRSRLDFSEMIRDWRSVALDGKMILLDYDDENIRGDVVSAFLEAIGLNASILREKSRIKQNESLPAFVCEIIRFLRMKGCAEPEIQKWISDVRQLRFSGESNRKYSLLPAELRESLDQRYASEVAKINADPDVGQWTIKSFRAGRSKASPDVIRHPVDAILAFGRELGRNPQGGAALTLPDPVSKRASCV